MGRALVVLCLLGGLGAGAVYAWPRVEARVFKTEVRVEEVRAVSPSQASTSVTATGYVIALTVTQRSGAQVVFVVEDHVARLRSVTLGPRAGESYELVQGPSPGSHVVLNPPAALSDGSPVKEVMR